MITFYRQHDSLCKKKKKKTLKIPPKTITNNEQISEVAEYKIFVQKFISNNEISKKEMGKKQFCFFLNSWHE